MQKSTLRQDSLVLYKTGPARVKHTGDKLEIELATGKTLKVRPKDITLLHAGPLWSLGQLQQSPPGDVETAWELLIGSTTTLAELAELIYDEFTPVTAWASWQLVAEGLYFRGTTQAIEVSSPEEVAQIQAARRAKAAEKEAWTTFLDRVRANNILPDDAHYLREVEDVALKRQEKSRLLRELGHAENPELGHSLLLKLGYWGHTVNPYPQRLGVPTTPPTAPLSELPNEERLDLTHLPAFAIDDAGTQDPDDAISLDGNRLWVHIADVAALIPPDSAADIEARARGANLYLPEGTVPMLPPQATQILALGLAEISPALSFGLDLAEDGLVTNLEVRPSWIKVRRLSYKEAENRLDEEPFQNLYRIAQAYQERRNQNGAININLPEVKIRVVDGEVIIRPLPPLKSRDLVREAMLMTGEAIARFALDQDIAFPFTSQNAPEEGDFSETMSGMFARRRTLTRSQVKSVPGPHAGLGMEIYTQATSPLRRYADLLAHQQLRAYLRDDPTLSVAQILERIGTAEAVSGNVRQAERLSNKHWTLVYLLNHPGWQSQGILVEKRYARGVVLIPDLDFEIRMHLRQDFPLDSPISLKLNTVNLAELDAHFRIDHDK